MILPVTYVSPELAQPIEESYPYNDICWAGVGLSCCGIDSSN